MKIRTALCIVIAVVAGCSYQDSKAATGLETVVAVSSVMNLVAAQPEHGKAMLQADPGCKADVGKPHVCYDIRGTDTRTDCGPINDRTTGWLVYDANDDGFMDTQIRVFNSGKCKGEPVEKL